MQNSLDSVLQCDTISSVMDTTIQLRVDQKTRRQITKLAAQERRTLSNYIRLLIERAIEEDKDRVIGRRATVATASPTL